MAKIMEDTDGKKYEFDAAAFSELVLKARNKKNHITSEKIYMQIAEACSVSVDAVKNWRFGRNGIGNIETAKQIAEVLHTDYHFLLISLDQNQSQEVKKMNGDEITIVKKIYGECIALIYEAAEVLDSDAECEKRHELVSQFDLEVNQTLRKLHMYLDQNSLVMDDNIRYRLHRILIDMRNVIIIKRHSIEFCVPESWVDISDVICPIEESFMDFDDRDVYLKEADHIDTRDYLLSEIALAEALDLDFIDPSDEELDTLHEIGDCTGLGYNPETSALDFEITPRIVAIDLWIEEIRAVFKYYFPNDFKEV